MLLWNENIEKKVNVGKMVLVINELRERQGIMTLEEAYGLAPKGTNLVLVRPRAKPPVVRLFSPENLQGWQEHRKAYIMAKLHSRKKMVKDGRRRKVVLLQKKAGSFGKLEQGGAASKESKKKKKVRK